ncbi:MAG: hypothetical protein ACPGWR_17010 [Ardenticatenaceae bacterium]
MTEASQYLLALAQDIAEPYSELPMTRAVMVTGSVAKGLSDFYSDIDMTIYYEDELPDEEALHAIRQQNGGGERKWVLGKREEGSFAEAYPLKGIEVQIGHTTIAAWEGTIAHVMEKLDVESPAQKAMEGTLACQALYGAEYIDKWKAQIAAYPDALAEKMVTTHLQFFPIWGLESHFRTRDATIWYQEILVESAQKLIAVLAGLNHLYFTTFQFKRTHSFINQMTIKPDNLAARLEGLFCGAMTEVLPEVESLVKETIALVEEHMPHIDTTRAKARIGWQHQAWQPQSVNSNQ